MRKLLIITALLAAASAFGRPSARDQQFLPDLNLLNNPGFESKTAQWETTGGSLGTTSVAANVYEGIRSAVWDPSASGQFMRSRLNAATMPKGLEGRLCQLSFWYTLETGATGDIVARVHDGTSAISADFDLAPAPAVDGFQSVSVYFDCPAQGTNVRAELESTADAAALTIDGVHLGSFKKAVTNVLPVVFEQTDDVTTFGTTGSITHNKNVPEKDQIWSAVVQQSGLETLLLDNGWITDIADNQIFYDFTGLNGADVVTIKLADSRQFSHLVENSARNFIYGPSGTAPATTLPHGLGSVPVTVILQHEQVSPGRWTDIGSGNYCDVDATNLYCTFPGSMTIDATHRIRIGVSSAINVAFFDGSVDQLGVGTNANDGFDPDANEVVIYDSAGTAGLTIATQTSAIGRINFQDNAGPLGSGNIKYQSSNNQLSFGTQSVEDRAVLDANGNWGLGTTAPIAKGHFRENGGVITGLHADTTIVTQKSQAAGDNTFVSTVSGENGSSGVYMGPVDNADEAAVYYDADGAAQNLIFRSNDATRAFFFSNGVFNANHAMQGPNGSQTVPTHTFTNFPNAGMFHDGTGLAFTSGGVERLNFTSGGQAEFTNAVRATDGAQSDPGYGFSADPDTGMYRCSGEICFTKDNQEWLRITASGRIQAGQNGALSTPTYTFRNDQDVGMYSGGTNSNILYFAAGGAITLEIDASSQIVSHRAPGTPTEVHYTFNTDRDSGLWLGTADTDMALVQNGQRRLTVNQTGTGQFVVHDENGTSVMTVQAGEFVANARGDNLDGGGSGDICHTNVGGIGIYYVCGSSKRFKKNIREITEEEASRVYEARGVYYNWKGDDDPDFGVVAEEMIPLFPELVEYNQGTGEVVGFNYRHYTGILTKVIQMHKDELDDHKREIDQLRLENGIMKAWICEQADAPLALCPSE